MGIKMGANVSYLTPLSCFQPVLILPRMSSVTGDSGMAGLKERGAGGRASIPPPCLWLFPYTSDQLLLGHQVLRDMLTKATSSQASLSITLAAVPSGYWYLWELVSSSGSAACQLCVTLPPGSSVCFTE